LENFCVDMEFMSGMIVSKYWRWCWGLITPLIMMLVFLYGFISLERTTYGDYELPMKAYASGWAAFAVGMLQLPIWAVIIFMTKKEGSWSETIRKCFRASDKWGPKNPKIKTEWRAFKDQAKKERQALEVSRWKHYLYSLNGTYRYVSKKQAKMQSASISPS